MYKRSRVGPYNLPIIKINTVEVNNESYDNYTNFMLNILKAKSNFTLLLYIPFLGIGEWYF